MAHFGHHIMEWAPRLLRGAEVTIYITIITMILATIWGLAIALLRLARIPVIHQLLIIYVEIFRGLPTILILFLVFFGLPSLGINISNSAVVVGIFALTLNLGAYLSETFRASILAVDPGQMEASISIGMSRVQSYRYIVLPQAFVIAIPTLGSYFIGLIKDSSLLTFISVNELMNTGNEIESSTFLAFQIYTVVGVMYIILSLIASRIVIVVERRLRPLEKRASRRKDIDINTNLPVDMRQL
jgi:His/Glu/Gln/Arg/opine family amino acid ABC transporter permease subunit